MANGLNFCQRVGSVFLLIQGGLSSPKGPWPEKPGFFQWHQLSHRFSPIC